jgi:hypothetical protein
MQRRGGFFGFLAVAAVGASCLVAAGAQAGQLPHVEPNLGTPHPMKGFSHITEIETDEEGHTSMTTSCGMDDMLATLAPTKEGQASTFSGVRIAAESCSVKGPGGEKLTACSVRDSVNKKAGFLETDKLNGRFVWLKEKEPLKESEEEAGIVFWPEAEGSSPTGKEPLMTTEITGTGCSVAGTYAMKGAVVAKVTSPAVGSKATTMTIEFPAKPITTYYEGESRTKVSAALKVGEKLTAKMSSIEEASLESKEEFGVFR